MDELVTRRAFSQAALQSLLTFSLIESLVGKPLFASPLRPLAGRWLAELDQLGREVKNQKIKQVEWQTKVEELFSRVDVADFLRLIDFETLARKAGSFNGKGALSLTVKFPEIAGVPTKLVFGRQIFALKKGRSVVPHGHNNMATCFLVLKGKLRGRHYDRVQDEAKHMILKPTIDKEFTVGGTSSISDVKDNVHWFEALEDGAFIFNIHVLGVTAGNRKSTGRVYVDPNGEKLDGGLIRGRLIDHDEATKLYG